MKKILFFCHAPQGTSGDVSSAVKLIRAFQEQYSGEVEVHLMVQANEKYLETIKAVCPKDIPFSFSDAEKENFFYFLNKEKEMFLKSFDAVVIYPTAAILKKSEFCIFKKIIKKIILASEYNFDKTKSQQLTFNWGENFPPKFDPYLETGFSTDEKKRLGLFITQEKKEGFPLTKIEEINGVIFRNFLFNTLDPISPLEDQETEYNIKHDLYFGYFNKLAKESNLRITPSLFIQFCLKRAQEKQNQGLKTIDIILPLDTFPPFGASSFLESDDLTQYTFEFYKNINGNMQCVSTHGEGKQIVRIINGFPFKNETMRQLMKAADPFVMVTGDQSLSEAISLRKIPFYQTMVWKRKMVKDFIQSTKKEFGEDSILYRYFKNFFTLSKEEILKYSSSEKELSEQMEKWSEMLYYTDNAHVHFPVKIMELITSPEKYYEETKKRISVIKEEEIGYLLEYTLDDAVENFIQFQDVLDFNPIVWLINYHSYNAIEHIDKLMTYPRFSSDNILLCVEMFKKIHLINERMKERKVNGKPYFLITYKPSKDATMGEITIKPGEKKYDDDEGYVSDEESYYNSIFHLKDQKEGIRQVLEELNISQPIEIPHIEKRRFILADEVIKVTLSLDNIKECLREKKSGFKP